MSDDKAVCMKCAIEEASFSILHEFTEEYPEVQMNYDAWTSLRYIIEMRMKQAVGIEDDPQESSGEGHTVQ